MADELSIVTDRDGTQKYRLNVVLEWAFPFDPDSPMTILWAPAGGIGRANLPFILQGNNGQNALITSVDFTALEYDDPTPDTCSIVELSPGSDTTPQVSKLVIAIHKGAPGDDGTITLDPADYGTAVAGRILVVKDDLSGFQYAPQKAGGMYWPTSLTEAPSATTAGFTVATITVPPNTIPFDWYPALTGQCIVSSTTADTAVDLVARLGTVGGAVLGKCTGLPGLTDRLILPSGPDAGASLTVNKIAANATATILLRTEKTGGAGTYATGIVDDTRFNMVAVAVP